MIFVFHFSIWFYHSVWLDIGSGLSEIDVFLKVAVFSAIVVLFALYLFPSSWRKWLFYPVNVLVAGLVSYPILLQQLNANFVVWTCNLILGNLTHTALTFFWSLACFLCVSIVLNIVDIQKSSESGSHKYQVSSPVRKLFHLAVLIIFLPGFVTSVPLLRCSTTCACVVFGMIECARYLHVFPFTGAFNDHLEIFRDVQKRGDEGTSSLLEQVDDVEALLCVLSPSLLESPWCLSEIERFCGRRDGGACDLGRLG